LDPETLLLGSGEIEGAGAPDASAQELQPGERGEADEDVDDTGEESPWKDVVVGSRKASDVTATDASTAKDREQRWSYAQESDGGDEDA
jgi:hypothetical protein